MPHIDKEWEWTPSCPHCRTQVPIKDFDDLPFSTKELEIECDTCGYNWEVEVKADPKFRFVKSLDSNPYQNVEEDLPQDPQTGSTDPNTPIEPTVYDKMTDPERECIHGVKPIRDCNACETMFARKP